jgi:chromosome segregation ATPase
MVKEPESVVEAARIYAQLISDIDEMRKEIKGIEKDKADLAAQGDINKLKEQLKDVRNEIKSAKAEREEVLKEAVLRSKKITAEASAKVAEAQDEKKFAEGAKEEAEGAIASLDKEEREIAGSKVYVKDQLRALDKRTSEVIDRENACLDTENRIAKQGKELIALAATIKSSQSSNEKASVLLKEMEANSKAAEKNMNIERVALASERKSVESRINQMQKESKELRSFYLLAKEARGILASGQACDDLKKKISEVFPTTVEATK